MEDSREISSDPNIRNYLQTHSIQFTHDVLINCAQKLGYSCDSEGLCNGFNMRWIEASLTQNESFFHDRILKITLLNHLLEQGIPVNQLEAKLAELNLQIDLWDIRAFYESLLLYQDTLDYSDVCNQYLSQDRIEAISDIASSDDIKKIGGLKTALPFRYDVFKEPSMTTFLSDMKEVIAKSGYTKPVCFRLSLLSDTGHLHTVSITLKPDGTWHFMDVNTYSECQNLSKNETPLKNLPLGYRYFSVRAILPNQPEATILLEKLSKLSKFDLDKCKKIDINHFLFLASASGDITCVRFLLKTNVNLDFKTPDGYTPLSMAAQNGHLDVVNALLASKVNPNLANIGGITPLFVATLTGHLDVINALLASKADPDRATKGMTPLYIAAKNGHLDVVKTLLASKADPNLANTAGITPLYRAVYQGHLAIVNTLLAYGADPNQASEHGITPLLIAAENGNLEVVNALLVSEADPNLASTDGITPLYLAAQNGHLEVVKALLTSKADPNQATESMTPLYIAAENGHLEVVKILLASQNIQSIEAISNLLFNVPAKIGGHTIYRQLKPALPILQPTTGEHSVLLSNYIEKQLTRNPDNRVLHTLKRVIQQDMNSKLSAALWLQGVVNGSIPFNPSEYQHYRKSLSHGELSSIFGKFSKNEPFNQPLTLKYKKFKTQFKKNEQEIDRGPRGLGRS